MHVSLLLQFVVGSTQKWRRMTGVQVDQLDQALTGYAHSPAHVTSTYFVLVGCRHSKLGHIV